MDSLLGGDRESDGHAVQASPSGSGILYVLAEHPTWQSNISSVQCARPILPLGEVKPAEHRAHAAPGFGCIATIAYNLYPPRQTVSHTQSARPLLPLGEVKSAGHSRHEAPFT